MDKYLSNPSEIQAIQWNGENLTELKAAVGSCVRAQGYKKNYRLQVWVEANHQWLDIEITEWIAKDSFGYYPIKDEVFKVKYKKVEVPDGPRMS